MIACVALIVVLALVPLSVRSSSEPSHDSGELLVIEFSSCGCFHYLAYDFYIVPEQDAGAARAIVIDRTQKGAPGSAKVLRLSPQDVRAIETNLLWAESQNGRGASTTTETIFVRHQVGDVVVREAKYSGDDLCVVPGRTLYDFAQRAFPR